ncbi:MAG: PilZ domain-containing protein [Deltaproteobacteria bacterium]|nr:PilZ domain-containing protein [Deltaproteobacteria bacterium]MBW2392887.1 PilZ domain-containing protein [Deltaproteobacteria bacterium]
MERRISRRIQRRAQCSIRQEAGEHQGMIVDVSEGGLAMVCPADLEIGSAAEIEFPGMGQPIVVKALIWNQRRVRYRRGESFAYGCIVENPAADFLDLIPDEKPREANASGSVAADSEASVDFARARAGLSETHERSGADRQPRSFKVRVRQCAGSRTKTLTLVAANEDEAREEAQASLGAEWDVLEVLEGRQKRQ